MDKREFGALAQDRQWDKIAQTGQDAVEYLIGMMEEGVKAGYGLPGHDRRTYEDAARTLGQIGGADALEFLLKASRSKSADMRKVAVAGLAELGGSASRKRLAEMAGDDGHTDVKFVAHAALAKANGLKAKIQDGDLSISPARDKTCAACRGRTGEPYKFYYGSKISEEKQGNTTVTKYANVTSRYMPLCRGCVLKRQMVNLSIGSALLAAAVYLCLAPIVEGGLKYIAFFPGVAGLIFFIMGISRNASGTSKAIALAKNKLRLDGFDMFWSSDPRKNK